MEAAAVMKVEAAEEGCALCGAGEDLRAVDEHEQEVAAGAPPPPLRAQLLHLTHNKVLPPGRICGGCALQAQHAYQFTSRLTRAEPLSDKIRALRRRLHDLTQKIDVFIVVGSGQEGGSYSERDIIMVERAALAAAAAADDDELERAHNARGDAVYQCSVCPQSFQRVAEFRSHSAGHGAAARHSCWACGAQFASRAALAAHAPLHRATPAPAPAPAPALACRLCRAVCQSAGALRQHEAAGACAGACPAPACGAPAGSRAALAAHAAARHGPAAPPPHVCPVCFELFHEAAALSAHAVRHRLARAFVCGHDGCILRFAARAELLRHVRRCHAEPAPPFGSLPALRRHARVHRGEAGEGEGEAEAEGDAATGGLGGGEPEGGADGVEYLEVETLEEVEEELEYKPDL